jgi:putative inorganic carbon (HCO3(-)) transporter
MKEKMITQIMEFIWLLIIFLIPLYFDRFIFNSWEIAKNILFQILTEILLSLFLIKIIFFNIAPEIKRRIKFLIPAFIFIFFLGISTIFSNVFWFSFWGNWERRMGYLAWLHFFIFASILFLNLKTKNQIKRIFISIIINSTIVTIYGFIQLLGLEPFKWTEEVFYTKRVYSTIGQPNFLASWLLLVIPILIFSLIYFKKFLIKFLIALSLIGNFICFIFTQSRGGWIGFFIAIFFFFFVFSWFKNNKKASIFFLLLFIFSFSLIIYLNLKPPEIKPTDHFLISRFKTLFNLKKIGEYRLIHYKIALNIIKNRTIGRFLIGTGLGSQRFFIPKYYQKEFAIYEAPNIYLDYFHNDFLDILFTSGVLGFLSYIIFIIFTFSNGLRNISKSILNLFLLTGLLGYLISIQFSFHVMTTLLYFWLFTSIIYQQNFPEKKNDFKLEKNIKSLKIILSFLIILLTLFFIYWFNLRLYLASHFLLKATIEKLKGNFPLMVKYHQITIKFQPDNPYFLQQFAFNLLQTAPYQKNEEESLKFLNLGIEQIEKIQKKERQVEALNWLAWLLTEKANLTQNEKDFQKAEEAYQELIEFVPNAALSYVNLCGLKIIENQLNEAIKICQRAISLYPNLNHPLLNQEHKEKIISELISVYYKLALIYFKMKDYQMALDYYKKILKLDPNQKSVWINIAQIYYLQKDLENAIDKLNHAYIRNPFDPSLPLLLSNLYKEKNDFEKANFWLEVAKKISLKLQN